MASGFCLRFLFLVLLAFGQRAKAFSYRSGDSSQLKPFVKAIEDFPSSNKPALASFSYESSTQSEGSAGISGPSYQEGSSENLKRAAVAPWTGGYRGLYGRQLEHYTPERRVSSFKPDLPISSELGKTPLQQHYRNSPNANRVPRNFFSAQKKRYELGIVSSPAIEMRFDHPESKTEPQHPSHLVWPQQPSYSIYQPDRPQQLSQQVWPQQPGRPLYPVPLAQPQHQHLSYPVFRPVWPQQLNFDMTQHKPDMWRFPAPYSEKGFKSDGQIDSGSQSEAQPHQPSYLTHVQPSDSNLQMGVEAGRSRPFRKVLVYGPRL